MKFAVLDLETTGHQPDDDIIQVGIVVLDEELAVIDTYSSFVRPNGGIPPFITRLTGIDDRTVENAPELDEVMMAVVRLIGDTVLVAHNVGFDASFLNTALDRCGYGPFVGRRLDTIELLRILYPSLGTYQLGSVTELFGIRHDRQHQADSDAMATAELFAACVRKMRELPLLTLQRFAGIIPEYDDLGWFVRQVLDWKQTQTSVDPDAYAYYNQFALKAGDWTDELPPRAEMEESPLENVSYEQYLSGVKSRFRDLFDRYEEREAQDQMFREVHEALENDSHLLIEAGTGTGKSLGYLIPALYYGIRQEKKIVVSTHTINLQEQLRQRDIPLLQELLPFPFKAAIFKGRGNYLCLRKFEAKVNSRDFASPIDDALTASQMVTWLGETETGDQEELNLGSKGAEFWSTVASDADSCLNRACPWFRRCFYHRAKHEAGLADVIITNHSMLFTDIRAEHRLLPAYDHLIVDEAHHLEEVAGKHLGLQLSYYSLVQPLTRLVKDARQGLLMALRVKLTGEDDEFAQAWRETIDELIPALAEAREHWDKLFELLHGVAGKGGDSQDNAQTVYRLRRDRMPGDWETIAGVEANVYAALQPAVRKLDKTLSEIKERSDDHAMQALVTDLNGCVKDISRARDDLRTFIKADKADTVYWIETGTSGRPGRSVHLFAVPADVSGELREYFFNRKKSVVLTSATLSVQKSFQYVCEQIGLSGQEEQGRLKTVQLPSPFNYREQALVIIPRNFPVLKGANGDERFVSMLASSLAEAARETNGRMLVLFTSYRMLRHTYDKLKEELSDSGIQVLGQGVDGGNRSKLTRRFVQQPASVLLGTSSFWEGVDIPGEALTCLAIVRLPFQPPNHPLIEAKSEMLQEQKQNPFMKLSVPQAVIRFKQGFGRLVRTAQDRGVVLIYDTRVIETYYGKHFLYSLPGPKIEHMHLDKMIPRMREWLAGGHRKEAEA
ncbi:ATP-dependent DNA helicase DinG [Paenibacillus cisolokensis]|uniref:ATP-dependent DNA helicase DinG n=1 Tax=Paenibacillus cisolokensis TaxID=1658519 RepID=UPI003D2D199E